MSKKVILRDGEGIEVTIGKEQIENLNTDLNAKASTTYVDTELSKKSDTTYVNQKIDDVIGGASDDSNTLKKVADIANQAKNVADTVSDSLSAKVSRSELADYYTKTDSDGKYVPLGNENITIDGYSSMNFLVDGTPVFNSTIDEDSNTPNVLINSYNSLTLKNYKNTISMNNEEIAIKLNDANVISGVQTIDGAKSATTVGNTYNQTIIKGSSSRGVLIDPGTGSTTIECDGYTMLNINDNYAATLGKDNDCTTTVKGGIVNITSSGKMNINSDPDSNNGSVSIAVNGKNVICLTHPEAGSVDVGDSTVSCTRIYGKVLQIYAKSYKNSNTSSYGSSGQVLISNGGSGAYWGSINVGSLYEHHVKVTSQANDPAPEFIFSTFDDMPYKASNMSEVKTLVYGKNVIMGEGTPDPTKYESAPVSLTYLSTSSLSMKGIFKNKSTDGLEYVNATVHTGNPTYTVTSSISTVVGDD